MRIYILLFVSFLLMACNSTLKKEAIEAPLPDSIEVSSKKLVMQGQGFRIASRMGFTAKVYKIGFYTDKKYSSASDILNSPSEKHMYMRFTYTITKGQLVDGWKKAYEYSCQKNCAQSQASFREFLEASTGMKIGEVMEITYKKTGIELKLPKYQGKTIFIKSPDFSYNLLSIFIGPKVLDEKFRSDLLSL